MDYAWIAFWAGCALAFVGIAASSPLTFITGFLMLVSVGVVTSIDGGHVKTYRNCHHETVRP